MTRNESQMTTLNATFDPFVGTLTNKEYGFVHFSSMTSNFLDNAQMHNAQKYKIWHLKLPKWTK